MGHIARAPHAIVFSDFDGTITQEETFSQLMREFAPEAAKQMIPRLLSGEITLREGVPAVLETISSSTFPSMERRMREAPLRPGFEEFLNTLEHLGIPLVVLSGSIEPLVLATLHPYRNRIERIVAAKVDLSGPFLKITSPYADHDELVFKPGVIQSFNPPQKIIVGDSVTDFSMARMGNLVFARSLLAKKLEEEGRKYIPFETFFEISNYLKLHQKNPREQ
ncbi:MAG: HAD-IB family phosphatase [Leptospirillia bacterium]